MLPTELRALRESLGLSRREFAPMLYISEPTLERWERGRGGPREVHLAILNRLREHLDAGKPLAYFEYDAAVPSTAAQSLLDAKSAVLRTLKELGAVLLEEDDATGDDWALRFGVGWEAEPSLDLTLLCSGSRRPERPVVDFTLQVVDRRVKGGLSWEVIETACFNHGVAWMPEGPRGGRHKVALRQRGFRTSCTPETIRHAVGNLRSCWARIREAVNVPDGSGIERVAVSRA